MSEMICLGCGNVRQRWTEPDTRPPCCPDSNYMDVVAMLVAFDANQKRVRELEAQVMAMRNCGNCRNGAKKDTPESDCADCTDFSDFTRYINWQPRDK